MKCRNCKHPRWAEEYPGRPFFGWCDEINDSPDMDIKRECRCFEPATNADIIRRMSDEELANFLCEIRSLYPDDNPCGECRAKSYCYVGHNGMEDWLQLPTEENT